MKCKGVTTLYSKMLPTLRRCIASSVLWGLAVHGTRVVGFVVVMAYVLRTLSSAEVGLWYVMLSIAGLAAVLDFGFTVTIGRHASYYVAGTEQVPRIGLSSVVVRTAPNRPAMISLLRMARKLYAVFGVMVGVFMCAVWWGWLVFRSAESAVTWSRTVDFSILTAGCAFNMTGMYWMAILFGLNRVRLYNQIQVLGLVVGYIVALGGLLAGMGITALVLGYTVGSAVPRILARREVLAYMATQDTATGCETEWCDLWPMTWRSGVVTLCSYVYIQGSTFMVSLFADLGTTAKYALTLQMALMLHQLSAIWVVVKQPEIGALLAQSRLPDVVPILRRRLSLSMATYAVGGGALAVVTPVLLRTLSSRTELLSGWTLVGLLSLVGLDLFLGHHSAILLNGNMVPHLRAFMLSAILAVLLAWPLTQLSAVWGVLGASFLSQVVCSYWWTPMICWRWLLGRSGAWQVTAIGENKR